MSTPAGYEHEDYIIHVEVALIRAGFETLDLYANDTDPRAGGIQIDTLNSRAADWFSGWDEVWLGWNEDRGWWIVCEDERDSAEPSRFVIELDVTRIASPASVARALGEKAGVQVEVDDEHPDADFPEHSFEDDDVPFELALRHYAVVS